jgi:hypothetical protein
MVRAVPNADLEWSADFSYVYLNSILTAIVRSRFDSQLLRDAPVVVRGTPGRTVFIRHDIDVAPRFVLPVARMEAQLGLRASYLVMTDCLLYSTDDDVFRTMLAELVELGHEVGLHVQVPDSVLVEGAASPALADLINLGSAQLKSITGVPVESFSFHRPARQFLRGPLLVAGKVSGCAAELMGWYLSDSAGRWREGPPVPSLTRPHRPLLQLLIHPVWWGSRHMSAPDRLQTFFREETEGKSAEFTADFDRRLSETIPAVRRSGRELMTTEELA